MNKMCIKIKTYVYYILHYKISIFMIDKIIMCLHIICAYNITRYQINL